MDYPNLMEITLSEHRFWLQIMGDHSRFIFYSLTPTESVFILKAQEFILAFDHLLEEVHQDLTNETLSDISRRAYQMTYELRNFKLQLLELSLNSEVKTHLAPTFFNDMLNELDEYLLVTKTLMNGEIPLFHPLHYHMLWLSDAIGHSSTLTSELDMVEKDLIDKAYQFEMVFHDLNFKATIMNGYQRTGQSSFPSLDRLNEQAANSISQFYEFLENIRDQRTDARVLGTLMPLMADHMAREECYYLWKLSNAAENIRRPNCDPGRPRMEM